MEASQNSPIAASQRIHSLDVLRGFSLLGILMINIRYFALPFQRIHDPAFPEGHLSAANFTTWLAGQFLFEDKMIAIFSMLFGAGILLFSQRLRNAGIRLFYRRLLWLFLFGLAHLYLLWIGDILMSYAICGAVFFLFRNLKPWILVGLGCLLVTVAPGRGTIPQLYSRLSAPPQTVASNPANPNAAQAAQRLDQGRPRSLGVLLSEDVQTAAYRGSWLDLFLWRAEAGRSWHFLGNFNFNFWRCGGFMLLGMGLLGLGILSTGQPLNVYAGLAIGGYAVGFFLLALGLYPQLVQILDQSGGGDASTQRLMRSLGTSLRHLAALFVAVAHVNLVLLLLHRFRLRRLAAVGRMALTNYLMQTILCVVIFEGWALGCFGRMGYLELLMVVLAIWAVQMIVSPWWLARFRFGPAEWLWRWLTYRL